MNGGDFDKAPRHFRQHFEKRNTQAHLAGGTRRKEGIFQARKLLLCHAAAIVTDGEVQPIAGLCKRNGNIRRTGTHRIHGDVQHVKRKLVHILPLP